MSVSIRVIQLPTFSALVNDMLSDLEYWELQDTLAARPDAGDLIPGGKGLRKMRWRMRSHGAGKSGGIRIVYYWRRNPSTIYFVTLFAKNRQENLTKTQLATLASYVERNLK
jgi:hypothetical protein